MSKKHNALFLAQSYKDTWDDYNRSLTRKGFARWDWVILTASNEKQAEEFEIQLAQRRTAGFLPEDTRFAVIPDEGGKRVGSGGATLGVLRFLVRETGKTDFSNMRLLVIHSGGDSKRVPQYSACGKLFSPVPHKLPDGRLSTLFDEFLIAMSSVPSRIQEGMLLLSGDVMLLFNPLQIDYNNTGAAAISFKEDVQTGKDHGVFLNGGSGNVKAFLHKQSEERLREIGAVNDRGCVDIDTGAVIFSARMLEALYSLIPDERAYSRYVNETVRLSLYGDFLYPLAEDSTLEQYRREKPEGSMCPELLAARENVWRVLRPFRMKLLRLAPAKFIHFGTTREILELMNTGIEEYADLGWQKQVGCSIGGDCAGYNSVLSPDARCGEGCYLETSCIGEGTVLGAHTIVSCLDVRNQTIPPHVVLHGLKQMNGTFVARIYGVGDNPKEALLFGRKLSDFCAKNSIAAEELWDCHDRSLWTARLYPECGSISAAVEAALNLFRLAEGTGGNLEAWRRSTRKSLCSGFLDADPQALIQWDERMNRLVEIDALERAIHSGVPASEIADTLRRADLTKVQQEWLDERLAEGDFSEKIRLNYYVGRAVGAQAGDAYIQNCFQTISDTILQHTMDNLHFNEACRIVTDRTAVRLPLRVNWGGGWSDTPPYCIERGGTVLNAAILLNGKQPVEVILERTQERKIVFDSRDMDVHGCFDKLEQLQAVGDPFDPFVLQKACLLACGVIPRQGGSLEDILNRLGGGFIMHSEVTGVPKGSGLGTSSILSAACVKAVLEFLGVAYTEQSLYAHVLAMEQLMSTGGGWQDQVGGVTDGIKYITSRPGMHQDIRVQHVELDARTRRELDARFCLIYTGQRRLARNLLRDVVGRYIGNEKQSLYAHNEIQRLAALMRFELERGNVDAFAQLLNEHWELSKMIDGGSTNTLINQIFQSVSDLIDGRMVCGAGGGGFLQVILKKDVTRSQLHGRLKEVFGDSAVDVWNCTLV